MANLHSQKYQIKLKNGTLANLKGKAAELLGIEGEPAYTTDTKNFFIHDGSRYLPPNADLLVFYENEIISYDNEAVVYW